MELGYLFLAVVLINGFAYITIRLRPRIYHVALYKPMVWNFKLSLLPFGVLIGFISAFISLMYFGSVFGIDILVYLSYVVFGVGFVIWLLMLPNSGYLITELNLSHRTLDESEVPIWYDIVSIMSFALSGILNTLANIVIVQFAFLITFDPDIITQGTMMKLLATAFVINLFVAVGVYLGRAIRFNSWDILHIFSFIKKLWLHFRQKGIIKNFCLFVIFHTAFFMIIYFMLGLHRTFAHLT